jgi:hypothetical protein
LEVSWSGQDDAGGSGIRDYTIYVSMDEGSYEVWLANTTETSATFSGEYGHTDAFYSRATDNVGHIEADPAAPDTAMTLVPLSTDNENENVNGDYSGNGSGNQDGNDTGHDNSDNQNDNLEAVRTEPTPPLSRGGSGRARGPCGLGALGPMGATLCVLGLARSRRLGEHWG